MFSIDIPFGIDVNRVVFDPSDVDVCVRFMGKADFGFPNWASKVSAVSKTPFLRAWVPSASLDPTTWPAEETPTCHVLANLMSA